MKRTAKSNARFTVCVLLYGDHTDLAKRCLESIKPLVDLIDLRIGLNEVSDDTEKYVRDQFAGCCITDNQNPQIFKYPMMRKLFKEFGELKEYTMWFDDDSFIKETNPVSWLGSVEATMTQCDMLGSVYSINYTDDQKAWAKVQPWYNGRMVSNKPRFATGGWWCIKSAILSKHDWPIPELRHTGGDVALGVMLNQQEYVLKHFNRGVAINADASGKESAAERRGFSGKERPVGKGFTPR